MTDANADELKRQARQDAIHYLVIVLTSNYVYRNDEPLEAAERLAAKINDALRESFFYEFDSSIAQTAHQAIMREVRDIIGRGLFPADRQKFAQQP